MLDTILNLNGGPRPEMIISDTSSYSDIVFGIFALIGYRFAPRIANLSDQRLWLATPGSTADFDYGPLNAVARHRVNLSKIAVHWDDMTRVAASLATGTVRTYDLLRLLSHDGNPTPLGAAITEYGRMDKTITYSRSLIRSTRPTGGLSGSFDGTVNGGTGYNEESGQLDLGAGAGSANSDQVTAFGSH